MTGLFHELLDNAVSEVLRREPAWFSRFELALPALDERAGTYATHPLFSGYSRARILECLHRGREHFAAWGVRWSSGDPDPIAGMLFDSVMDAAAAEDGRLPLKPDPNTGTEFAESFLAHYDQRVTSASLRIFTGRQEGTPLLLVPAIGVPLETWSKLLLDPPQGRRVIVVETRHADLFEGGLRGDATPESDAADIAGALKEQNASRLDVLSWSNGARVAIDLAASQPALVRSLVLVAPALSGVEGVPPMPSQFEEELTTIFAAVRKNPVAGSFFSKALRDSIRQRDWDKSSAPGQRARTLLGLPAAGQAPMLIAPLANAALLGHFMGRYAADLVYPMSERIASLKLPMLVVAGEHDTIVNNSYNEAVLACFAPHAVRVAINGAGHCIQDLEYRYLRLLLEEFLADARAPRPAARVHV